MEVAAAMPLPRCPCLQDLHVTLGGVHTVVQGLDGHPANWQAALGEQRVTIRGGGMPCGWRAAMTQLVLAWWVIPTDSRSLAHCISANPMEMLHSCLTIVFFT